MAAELPDVRPQGPGTLGAYVKFGEGVIAHTSRYHDYGVLIYHPENIQVAGGAIAIEGIPGREALMDAHEGYILTLIAGIRRTNLSEETARDVLAALREGRADA
jgi:hypothetical protein